MFLKNCATKFVLKRVNNSLRGALGSLNKHNNTRYYSLCCPPTKGGGRRIQQPINCRPVDIPYNPCCPQYHHGKDTWKKYKYITFFVCFPLIILQYFHVAGHETPPKGECRDYEYMRIRNKKYPWGDGNKTFFHNDHVNHAPGECVPPPLDCD